MFQGNIVADISGVQIRRIEDFHERLAEVAEHIVHDAFGFLPATFHAALNLENPTIALLLHQLSYKRA